MPMSAKFSARRYYLTPGQIESSFIARLISSLSSIAMEGDCLLCAAASPASPVCPPCTGSLPVLGDACPICALPTWNAQVCGQCQAKAPNFDRTVAAWPYDYPIDRLIHSLKFRHHLELAWWFAEALVAKLSLPNPTVVAMPLHHSRLAERGFNQALEIARLIATRAGGKLLPFAVERHRKTRLQSELPLADRGGNVRGAFRSRQSFAGETVVVVDDVMTSGATLNELARTLKQAGAKQVVNIVAARTLPFRETSRRHRQYEPENS